MQWTYYVQFEQGGTPDGASAPGFAERCLSELGSRGGAVPCLSKTAEVRQLTVARLLSLARA